MAERPSTRNSPHHPDRVTAPQATKHTVFTKLGIRSRRQLRAALSEDGRLVASA